MMGTVRLVVVVSVTRLAFSRLRVEADDNELLGREFYGTCAKMMTSVTN